MALVPAHSGTSPYHRIRSPTQTDADAARQLISGEIWGKGGYGGDVPSVKAYRGPLPIGRSGVEFVTGVAPTPGTGTLFEARWYCGTPGVFLNDQGYAVVQVEVTKWVP